jgi:hypothetical protein
VWWERAASIHEPTGRLLRMVLSWRSAARVALAAVVLAGFEPSLATAQQPGGDVAPANSDLVEVLVIQHFAEKAANDARWGAQLGAALRERDAIIKERQLEARRRARAEVAAKAAGARAQNAEARAAALEVELLARDRAYTKAVAENSAMVTQIAQRDRDWAAEVAAYREQLTAFVAASSPERLALLRRFAGGDRSGAYPLLLELIDLESRARGAAAEKIAAEVRGAAAAQADNDRRLVGILALDGLGSHEISVQQAMVPWQAIVDSGRGQRSDYLLLSGLWAL